MKKIALCNSGPVQHGPLSARKMLKAIAFLWIAITLTATAIPSGTWAQENPPAGDSPPLVGQSDPELVEIPPAETNDETASKDETVYKAKGLNLLNLLTRGGWFMIPLGLLSIVVVTLAIERMLALREEKILPQALVRELGNLSRHEEGFDPRLAFRACQVHPSAASRVLRVMLLKAGRPQSEVEHAVAEASEREATRLQSLVSWLTLAAAVAPLIGLLGTVWGMIQAFYDTTQLVAGQNKAEILAQGIYTALVTTLCGLIIAIPSAVLAHFFDNRIVGWFHRIEELAASLTPMLEPYEGRMRTSMDGPAGNTNHAASRDKTPVATNVSTSASSINDWSGGGQPDEIADDAVVPPPGNLPR